MINISKSANISPLADIEDSIRGTEISIGAHSAIDAFVKIKPSGGSGNLIVGEYCYINSGTVLYTGNGISIGNHVLIAANCTLAPTNHQYRDRHQLIRQQGFGASKGGILIEDDVWIGANVVILDGSILRQGCVIAAGSIVKGEVPKYGIAGGNPLQVFSERK